MRSQEEKKKTGAQPCAQRAARFSCCPCPAVLLPHRGPQRPSSESSPTRSWTPARNPCLSQDPTSRFLLSTASICWRPPIFPLLLCTTWSSSKRSPHLNPREVANKLGSRCHGDLHGVSTAGCLASLTSWLHPAALFLSFLALLKTQGVNLGYERRPSLVIGRRLSRCLDFRCQVPHKPCRDDAACTSSDPPAEPPPAAAACQLQNPAGGLYRHIGDRGPRGGVRAPLCYPTIQGLNGRRQALNPHPSPTPPVSPLPLQLHSMYVLPRQHACNRPAGALLRSRPGICRSCRQESTYDVSPLGSRIGTGLLAPRG